MDTERERYDVLLLLRNLLIMLGIVASVIMYMLGRGGDPGYYIGGFTVFIISAWLAGKAERGAQRMLFPERFRELDRTPADKSWMTDSDIPGDN